MSQIIHLVADTETLLDVSPFNRGQAIQVDDIAGTGPLYGVDKAADASRVTLDGTAVAFTVAEIEGINDADGTWTTAIADRLKVVVLVKDPNGKVLSILNRISNAGTPSAGEFKVSGTSPNVTLTLGDAGIAGQDIEVWLNDTVDSTTLVQSLPNEAIANQVMAAAEVVVLTRLIR